MSIAAGTNIRLLRGVPLDSTHINTLYFESAEAQEYYFIRQTKYNLSNYTYQRQGSNKIKVGVKCDLINDCNYLMFQNESYTSKWFYAFITSVEYINDNCSLVTYEIDALQTYLLEFHPNRCFVEREHSETDEIGEHIEPENVATGEYVFNDYSELLLLTDYCVIIAIVDVDGNSDGTVYDGVYGGVQLFAYDISDITSINQKIDSYTSKPDAILSIYMCPKQFVGTIPSSHRLSYGSSGVKTTISLPKVTEELSLNGYHPHNRKLYTYPFNFYHVDNASGHELSLRYELFENLTPLVEVSSTVTQPVTGLLRPVNYKGLTGGGIGGNKTLNTENIQLSNFPVCSWNVDTYKMWLAQNATPIALNTIAGLAGAATGNPIASALSLQQITGLMSNAYTESITADICRGSLNNGCINVAIHTQTFYGGRCSITAQYAKCIDDYMDMYGYATNRVKIPNTHARPHWSYIKTVGCTGYGNIPAEYIRQICECYDNGITFWKNADDVGNYTLDNRV